MYPNSQEYSLFEILCFYFLSTSKNIPKSSSSSSSRIQARKQSTMSSTSDPRYPKPITGYPAVVTGVAAGFAYPAVVNGVAAGTAYPYPAPPPPDAAPYYPNPNPNPNGYYPNPNPNDGGYDPTPNPIPNRSRFLRHLLAVTVAVVLIIGAVTFIVWLILRPKLPDFYVSSFDISSFSLSSSNSLSAEFNINFTVRNPNSKMSVGYEEITAAVFYNNDLLSDSKLPPFFQKTGDVTDLKAKLVAEGAYIGDDAVNGIRSDRGKGDGAVKFGTRVLSIVKFKAGAWRTRNHVLRVLCDDIGIGFKNATAGVGSMVEPAKLCQVGL